MEEAVGQITHWADRFDCMVIGPGLGRDELVHDTVKEVGTYILAKQLTSLGCLWRSLESVMSRGQEYASIFTFLPSLQQPRSQA